MTENLTQKYSTWGDKLLQHTDVLYKIQNEDTFTPVTIQIALTEVCDSDCPFCSVADRPIKSSMPFEDVEMTLKEFKKLGAKSVEITGGGNPLLYRTQHEGDNKNINDVISLAHNLGFDIGIITNSHDLKYIHADNYSKLNWVRVSLIKLDEGKNPEDYNFRGFPMSKLGFSYIIYDSTDETPNPFTRTKRFYEGTSEKTLQKIDALIDLHPEIKFVRLAGNCLIKGNNEEIKKGYSEFIKTLKYGDKIFIKDIGLDDDPFDDGCYVGAIRPYIAANPEGGDYQVYICTSHVLNKRTYDLDYSLGSIDNISEIWGQMNKSHKEKGYPYEVSNNSGCGWKESCKYCYYKFNNKLLHTVANEMPEKNFP